MGVRKNSSNERVLRAWYPSGPRIGGDRPTASPSSRSTPPTASNSYSPSSRSKPPLPDRNPDPANYKVIIAEECGNYLIVKLNYPNCTNFEGNKILVFQGIKLIDLMNQRLIDPHFFQDKKYASPIARFVPTTEGLVMAKKFIVAMNEVGDHCGDYCGDYCGDDWARGEF